MYRVYLLKMILGVLAAISLLSAAREVCCNLTAL